MYKRFPYFFLILILIFSYSPAQAQSAEGAVYIVQTGDSLSSIAARFNVELSALMSANNLTDPNQLYADQRLVIPGMEGVSGVLRAEFVNFGDSYRSLMRRSQIPEPVFQKINHIVSPSEFYVGVSLIVPEQAQALNKRIALTSGESLLELAVKNNSDAWTLARQNRLRGWWDALPADALFTTGEANPDAPISGLPAALLSAQIRDLPVKQGGTSVIQVKTMPSVTLSGVLIDRPLHFFPAEDGLQIALQGVHALLTPGVYPLRIDATLPDGATQSYEQMILVASGYYPDDPLLYVPPETIDPAETEPELQLLIGYTTPATPEKLWSGDFTSPASEYADSTYFTSRYGNRRTYIGQGTDISIQGFHTGLDFGGGVGLPITAPARGRVVFTGNWVVRGGTTIIDHGWGVYSGFWHQSRIGVNVGDMVEQGQVIGDVGGTGRITGPHLHWELWVNGIQADPLDWLTYEYP